MPHLLKPLGKSLKRPSLRDYTQNRRECRSLDAFSREIVPSNPPLPPQLPSTIVSIMIEVPASAITHVVPGNALVDPIHAIDVDGHSHALHGMFLIIQKKLRSAYVKPPCVIVPDCRPTYQGGSRPECHR